jgi:hypothetical protein
MNKKTLAIITALLVLSMTLTPLALAKPWEYPKNNEKFQSFHVELTGSMVISEKDYKPNEDNPNVIVQSWGNNILSYDILIGGVWHYLMGVDFEYDQECVWTAIGAPFIPLMGIYVGSKSNIWIIEYEFDFSAVSGGIDGTLKMLFVYNNGGTSIRSLRGTGDLQNVQIMATASVMGFHEGIVIGWPDIPPATP